MPKAKRKPLIDDTPTLTKKDFARSVPFEQFPTALQRAITAKTRGAQEAPTKVPVSIRLSRDVADSLRATGAGWQTRADEALRAWLEQEQKLAS